MKKLPWDKRREDIDSIVREIIPLIKMALSEDKIERDLSSEVFGMDNETKAEILLKGEGAVLCGVEVVKKVFEMIDEEIEVSILKKDGDFVIKGEKVVEIVGRTKNILRGERTSLNFLQRLSGIATTTNMIVKRVEDYPVVIVDTRKTTPGLRSIEKFCVRCGGAKNHRMNLEELLMLKENHIFAAGGIKKALDKVFELNPYIPVEIEVKNLEEFKLALQYPVDVVMCDNFKIEDLHKAVKIGKGKVVIEVSGGITYENVVDYAKTGVDVISIGSLTHSFNSVDFSLLLTNKI